MELQGRTLSIRMRGDDIALLHRELGQLGFTIPQDEVERQFFGRVTREIVLEFQSRYPDAGLEAGKVDQTTANLINAAVDALHTRQFLVRGQVRQVDNAPLVGLVVRVFDQDPQRGEVLLGEAMTNNDGFYEIPYTSQQFDNYSGDRPGPDLFVRVFNPQGEVLAASSMIHRAQPVETVDLVVEPAKPEPPFIVQGQVLYADGRPLAGGLVRAFDKDLRDEQELGNVPTNQDGYYRITYTADQFRRAEKKSADLKVQVFITPQIENPMGPIPPPVLLVESPIIFNAKEVETVDLIVSSTIVPGLPSEVEQIIRELGPLLVNVRPDGIPNPEFIDQLADLKADEIDFLTGETGIERQKIAFLVTAATLQKWSNTQDTNIPAAIFYGLAREDLPLDLMALYRQGPQKQRAALERAIADNIIPALYRQSLDSILENLQRLLVRHALLTKPTAEGHSLSELLSQSALPQEKHTSLLNLYVNHEGTIEEFWQKLPEHPDFQEPSLVKNIQFTFQLGVLTQNHVPLSQALRERYQPSSTRQLVELDTAAWTGLVNRVGVPTNVPGETPEEKTKNYVNNIISTLQVAFPTETVAQIVAKAPNINLDEPTRTAVSQFYQNISAFAEDQDSTKVFDIRTTRVENYVTNHAETAFHGIPKADRPKVVAAVKRQQRAFRLSTGPETMTALLGNRFDSAHAIANTPRATFVEQMKLSLAGEHQAQAIYDKAQHINTTNLLLYTQIRDAYFGVYPRVMAPPSQGSALTGNGASSGAMAAPAGSNPTTLAEILQKHSPTWAELFGSLDLCECEHCRSMLSPAAYFVDLLHLLENSKPYKKTIPSDPNEEGKVPLELLLRRRPDLEYIKLTCENTNTPIPYVDLVNEILESYVALGHLDQTTAKDTGDSTAEELSANPQYVEDAAYDQLKQAVYPLTMPYNRFVEAARVYLEHLGSSRDQVMQTFQKKPSPPQTDPTPRRSEIDAESLMLSPEEYEVLTGLKFDGTSSNLPLSLEALYGANAFAPSKLPVLKPPQPGESKSPASPVLTLQRALNATGANQPLTPNGVFDDKTVAAVKVFQANHSLSANGEVDLATWTALQQALPKLWQLFLAQVSEFLVHSNRIVYTDLIELLKTHFINPNYLRGEALEIFQKIPFSYATLASLVQSKFATLSTDPKLQLALQNAGLKPQELIDWSNAHFQQIQKLIVLESPDSTCNLEVTTLQHLDGTLLTDEELIRLNHFIRLWRKLGWTISDLDKTLTALGATDITPTFLQQLAQVKRLQTNLKIPLVQLLSLWASIDTHGEKPLYEKLFQNKSVLNPVDADLGLDENRSELELMVAAYNPTTNIFDPAKLPKIADPKAPNRVATILAALRISAADLDLIRADANLTGDGPYLTLVHLSVFYRYTALAKALKLKVKDLIALKQLSGVSPFSDPVFDLQHPDPQHLFGRFENIAPDRTQRFVDIVRKVQRSGFSVAQLNYLYRHQWEPGQNPAPSPESVALLVKTIQDGLKKIAQENLPGPDPMGELTRTKLATIFEPAIADQVVGMINGSFLYTARLDSPPTITFPASIATKIIYDAANSNLQFQGTMSEAEKTLLLGLSSELAYRKAINELFEHARNAGSGQTTTTKLDHLPVISFPSKKVAYDWSARILQFTGPMTKNERDLLKTNAPPDAGNYIKADYRNAIDQLFQQPQNFITKTLAETLTDFLNPPDAISYLLETPSVDADGKPDAAAIARKFAYVLEHVDHPDPNKSVTVGLLPYLRDKLSRSLVKQTLSDELKLDGAVMQVLLEPVFNPVKNIKEGPILKAFTDPTKPAISDFLALIGDGFSAEYFNNDNFMGNATVKRIDPTVDFSWGQDSPDPSITEKKFRVRWTGKLLAQFDETYTFYLHADGTLQLWIDDQLFADQGVKPLKAGQLYDIRVEYVRHVRTDDKGGANAELQWSSLSTPRAIIPQSQLYSGTASKSFDLPLKSYYLLHKVALLVNTFKMTDEELVYLSAHSKDFDGFNLNTLPLTPSDFKVALFDQWLRLYDLLSLRNSLPKGEIDLIHVFEFAASGADKSMLGVPIIKELATIIQQNSEFVDLLVTWSPSAFWQPPIPPEKIKPAIKLLLSVDWTGLSETEIIKQLKTNQPLVPVADPPVNPSPPPSSLVNLLAKLTDFQALSLLLATATGWSIKDLDTLIGPEGFNLKVADFKNEQWLVRLQACLQLVKRLGVSPKKLFDWAAQTPDSVQARDIKNTVKAKYDDQAWLAVAKPLSDTLRESQKAALIAYLLPRLGFASSNQIFEHFLIDVEMSACMKTSRIKQAISSVQLFVDRCLMNLEAGVLADAIDPDVWKWMKNYRVWEANRKVFLYPENWIEPELRDNKTPFFKELESELLQNDITIDAAEKAFLNYLEKLDEVARLEICGMYWETREEEFPSLRLGSQGPDVVALQRKLNALGISPQPLPITGVFDATTRDAVVAFQKSHNLNANGVVGPETWAEIDSGKIISILHVFGRTFHVPHMYYYRRLINDTTWTPWEKVQVDIEGDHLIPVVWNRRLHIFWPIFTEKAIQPTTSSMNDKTSGADEQAIQSAASSLKAAADAAINKLGDRDTEVDLLNKAYDLLSKLKTDDPMLKIQADNLKNAADSAHNKFGDEGLELALITTAYLTIGMLNREKPSTPAATGTNEPPPKYWEIKLAWSEYRNNKWSAKQLSPNFITFIFWALVGSVLPAKDKFTFKALVGEEDSLKIQVYYTYDRGRKFDHLEGEGDGVPVLVGECEFKGCKGRIDFHNNPNRLLGAAGDKHLSISANEPALVFPTNLVPEYMWLRGELDTPIDIGGSTGNLYLFTDNFSNSQILHEDVSNFVSSHEPLNILQNTPSVFRLLYPHQYPQFALNAPFFYQDDHRTYFVTPTSASDLTNWVGGATPVLPESGVVDSGSILLRAPAVSLPNREVPAGNEPERLTVSAAVETLSAHNSALVRSTAPLLRAARLRETTKLTANWANQVESSYIRYWESPVVTYLPNFVKTYHLNFAIHYHPYVCEFIKALNRRGILGLLTVGNQIPQSVDPEDDGNTVFNQEYRPTNNVDHPYPHMKVDLSTEGEGAYSLYNWELFFHIVMRIATSLSQNQRFEEARHWFHYILNPTAGASDQGDKTPIARYWKLVPFKNTEPERIDELLEALSYTGKDPQKIEQKIKVQKQILEYMYHPFQPHAIARLRLSAYMKNVVMKYIDNLIAWGDQLFRRDTIESINEATLLYVLAANMLGPKPQFIPPRGKAKPETYASLKDRLNLLSNAITSFENDFPFSSGSSTSSAGADESSGLLGLGRTLYFCTPQNDKLLSYWDTVADRLFKIRHCMNIEGIVRELPLFEPPIDPALLVRAAAAGVDLTSVLNNLYAPLPHYRFNVMMQKATELCAEVKALGAALLSAWEKKDAEELATIRARQETSILELVKLVKQQQYEEAIEARNGLAKSREVAVARYLHYQKLLGQENQPVPQVGDSIPESTVSANARLEDNNGMKLISYEKEHLDRITAANNYHMAASVLEHVANILHLIPDFHVEPFGVGTSTGGPAMGTSMSAYAKALQNLSSKENMEGSKASTLGGYLRRQQEWVLQSNLAAKEIMQIDKQIAAADIRVAIAQQEITNHDKQIQNAKEIEDFLRDKFTSKELYNWMVTQISGIYFQSYQLTYDVAKRVERCYRFELGLTDSNFIKFGYWDSLKKGLLAGEKLHQDLKRMEMVYLDQNKREYEITKHVSLVLHDPLALIALKETGQCEIFLPEALFDADYPGHYMRRIKSVSLTLPCIVGPYTSINCTLTLLSNKTRIKSTPADPYPENLEEEDKRFVTNFAAMQSIATSHAQNDSGMFELNFRDERYLPFEGAGIISRWRIELPRDTNAFDINTLSDGVLQLKYTAREGGEILKKEAKKAVQDTIADEENAPLARLFSLKHEFPTEWHKFLHPKDTEPSQTLQLDLKPERFPFLFRGKKIQISQVELFLIIKDEKDPVSSDGTTYLKEYDGNALNVTLTPNTSTDKVTLKSISSFMGGIPHGAVIVTNEVPVTIELVASDDDISQIADNLWRTVTAEGKTHYRLNLDAIEDVFIVCHYSVG